MTVLGRGHGALEFRPRGIDVLEGVLDLGDIRLRPGLNVRGRVLDAAGTPQPNIDLYLHLLPDPHDPLWSERVSALIPPAPDEPIEETRGRRIPRWTDAEGRFGVVLPPGWHSDLWVAWTPGHRGSERQVRSGVSIQDSPIRLQAR